MNLTLDQVVREYLIESYGAATLDQRFPRFYQIAVSGMREINSDIGWKKAISKLELRDNNTAPLPIGYIDYFRIGLCSGDDILAFAENKKPCVIGLNVDDCGQVEARTEADYIRFNQDWNFSYNSQWTRYSKNGQFVGRDFGVRGGFPVYGTFQINKDEGYVYIESALLERDSLVIEYATILPRNGEGSIVVHPYEVEALKAWLYWKSIQRLKTYPMAEKEMAKQQYGIEKRKARKRINAVTMQELISAARKGYGAAPGI